VSWGTLVRGYPGKVGPNSTSSFDPDSIAYGGLGMGCGLLWKEIGTDKDG
jgi:hypothetical protein